MEDVFQKLVGVVVVASLPLAACSGVAAGAWSPFS